MVKIFEKNPILNIITGNFEPLPAVVYGAGTHMVDKKGMTPRSRMTHSRVTVMLGAVQSSVLLLEKFSPRL